MENPLIRPVGARAAIGLEIVAIAMLAALWAAALYYYNNSPSVVPVHFKFSGEADGFGDRSSFWFVPALCTGLYLLLSGIARYPKLFNYPAEITPENAKKQYALMVKFLRVLKIALIGVCLIIEWHTYMAATGRQPGNWVFGLAIALIMVPVFWYLISSFRLQ